MKMQQPLRLYIEAAVGAIACVGRNTFLKSLFKVVVAARKVC